MLSIFKQYNISDFVESRILWVTCMLQFLCTDCHWDSRVGGCEAGCWAWGPALKVFALQNAGNFNGTSLLYYEQYSTMRFRMIYQFYRFAMFYPCLRPIEFWLQERQLGCQFGHWRLLKRLGQGSQAGGADSEALIHYITRSSWSAGLA